MYEGYWKLQEKPFENTPNPRFLYASSQHEEGLARCLYGIRERKGAVMLTGIFGCGKTLLAHTVFQELEKDLYKIALVTNPRMSELDLLRFISYQLSGNEAPNSKADVLIRLQDILMNNLRDGRDTVIVVDEAHIIDEPKVFEEIRLLLNFQLDDRFLCTVLLLGQPELGPTVNSIKQLSQRIAIRYHLEALNNEEVNGYIVHRLDVAGGRPEIFSPEAMALVNSRSGGIPRRINQIADMALFIGSAKEKKQVDPAIIEEAIESLEG